MLFKTSQNATPYNKGRPCGLLSSRILERYTQTKLETFILKKLCRPTLTRFTDVSVNCVNTPHVIVMIPVQDINALA